jgi:MobA-like NTP transferase protein
MIGAQPHPRIFMARRTLILPCAGRSSRYPGVRPKWMLTLPQGEIALQRAAASLPADSFDRIVIAVRADHEERYGCRALVKRVFGDAEIVVLPHETRGPADTVAETIARAGVAGAIAIKDADSFFDPLALPETSFVSVSDVRRSPQMTHVGAKSFAVINGEGLIVDMVEKSLASNHVCVGLYGFADARRFVETFDAVAGANPEGEIFVSHVVSRAIRDGLVVAPHAVEGLIDVGTLDDWRRYTRARGTIVADIDGVVFRNHSRYFEPLWDEPDEPIAENIAALRAWEDGGAQLIFMTARPEAHRARTESALRQHGLTPHALIMDCRHGRRFLVNDHAGTNPAPSAVAISLERDSATLAAQLSDWR